MLVAGMSLAAAGKTFDEILLEEFGELGRHRYGSTWWQEHHNDPYTLLLLHFGKPQPYALAELSEERLEQRRKRENLEKFLRELGRHDSLRDSKTTILTDLFREMRKEAEAKVARVIQRVRRIVEQPPVEEPKVPTDMVYDYSDSRRTASIDDMPGTSFNPDGRFGSAIEFDGTSPGIKFFKGKENIPTFKYYGLFYTYIEFWMKISEYPGKNACIFSSGGGEGRLMLRPDGHLDMVRLNPHGTPQKQFYKDWSSMEAYEKAFEAPTELVSDRRIPLNEWTYVTVWRSQTAVTNMQLNYIWINGEQTARMVGTPHDHYNMFYPHNTGDRTLVIGNDHKGEHPFKGLIDELRIPTGGAQGVAMFGAGARRIHPPPPDYEWRDADADRPLDFGRPFFYRDGAVFHLGFDDGLIVKAFEGDSWQAELTNPVDETERLKTEGIRGRSLTLDPRISRVRIPVEGKLTMDEGSLEFWLQPLNWDNGGGNPELPTYKINMLRFYCETPDGEVLCFPITGLPRRGGKGDFHPGRWAFFCMTWNHRKPERQYQPGHTKSFFRYRLYNDPESPRRKGRMREAEYEGGGAFLPCYAYDLKPLYVEFGIHKPAIAADGREPIILVDEVVGHNYELAPPEVMQAKERVMGRLEKFETMELAVEYKYGIDELSGTVTSLFPPDVEAEKITVTVLNPDGARFAPPVTQTIDAGDEDEEGDKEAVDIKTRFLFSEGKRPPANEPLRFRAQVFNADGEKVFDDDRFTWTYTPAEWRGNDLGVPAKTPAPWTPVAVDGNRLETLMTQYQLGENGLPAAIIAKGENLLARPVQLLEEGKPMKAQDLTIGASQDAEADWSVRFEGKTCDVTLNGRIEFDGLTRYELDVEPKTKDGVVAPLRFEIPMKPEYATHRMFQHLGGRLAVRKAGPDVFSGRAQRLAQAQRRARRRNRIKHGNPAEIPTDETFEVWDFWPIMDLCNRERGLFWFADKAAGWGQSNRLPAQEFQRDDNEHRIVLHLVAESATYQGGDPIVFGIIPHPAKPLPRDYRYFEREPSPEDPNIRQTYGATFAAVPRSPKHGMMGVYPRRGDWEHAESVRIYVEMMKPFYRTMYLSLAWLSCRAGGYDNWAWRNGDNSKVSLTDSFVEYLCWEMDEWLKRGIYNAVYLDESYAWECSGENALKAGQAIRMPDGTVQPGMRLWHFRKLMKRWYTLFGKHGHRPMILSHHSRYWMYPGMVFATSNLDGESFPIVTAHGRSDFVDKLSLDRFEVVNNPYLWGTVSFYMPSIWEKGPGAKSDNPHPAWSWRMARGAQSIFAHLENGTTFVDQGGNVYSGYSKVLQEWGALNSEVEFVPWFKTGDELQVPGQGEDVLVSYYRDKGRILLIASNRAKKERPIPVTLDFAALGLPDNPTFEVLKGAYQRPKGIDPWRHEPETPKAKSALRMATPEMDPDSLTLEDPEVTAARKAAQYKRAHKPTLEGNVLTVPVRDHDFRMISLE